MACDLKLRTLIGVLAFLGAKGWNDSEYDSDGRGSRLTETPSSLNAMMLDVFREARSGVDVIIFINFRERDACMAHMEWVIRGLYVYIL